MIHIAQLCLTAALGTFPPADTGTSGAAWHVEALVAPQGHGRGRNHGRPGNPPPSGGTPEPASMLLLGGAVLGYGALRMKRRKAAAALRD